MPGIHMLAVQYFNMGSQGLCTKVLGEQMTEWSKKFTFLHKPLSGNIYCYDPQMNSQSQLRQDTTIAQYSQGWS